MARTSSIIMPSMVGIVNRAPAVDELVALLSQRGRAMLRICQWLASLLR